MGSSPKVSEPAVPAQRPERTETVDPENIVAGDSDEDTSSDSTGRRALRRPSSGSGTASVGTGLSV